MPKILLHGCCAHCTAYTVEHFRKAGYDVIVLWYNPNIHSYQEHQARLEAMKTLSEKLGFNLVIVPGYDFINYLRTVSGHEDTRCEYCFRLRLNKTAETAAAYGIGEFSTSLLISPHIKHDLVKINGEQIGLSAGASFSYVDLRKRFSDSRHMTKPLELYRQQYCGCVYSEYERFSDDKPIVRNDDKITEETCHKH